MDESQSGGASPHDARGPVPRAFGPLAPLALLAREWLGWVVLAAGAALCVLGWYGVSGEAHIEQQVPFLASATVPGAALIVSGALLLALRRHPSREGELTDRRLDRLYALLVEPDAGPEPDPGPAPPGAGAELLAVPEGAHYHHPDCRLIAGKPQAVPVLDRAVRERGLTPCPLCDPPPPATAPGA